MPIPITAVPINNPVDESINLELTPAAISIKAINNDISTPTRLAKLVANGEPMAKANNGKVVSMPAWVGESANWSIMDSRTGPSAEIGARRLVAIKTRPTTNNTRLFNTRETNVAGAGTESKTRTDI